MTKMATAATRIERLGACDAEHHDDNSEGLAEAS